MIKGEFEFENVCFNYPSHAEANILDFLSSRIKVGSKVALVGPSGAGKSSIFALLLRFYDPSERRILIDGKEIRKYNLRKLRSQIGYVQQEPLPFSCTIRENICYGDDKASEAEIIEVSRAANIPDFISNLSEGYDTMAGKKGCQLSGGQKQRIAIARALLKKPPIMLLDEATSALDAESEKAVVSALDSVRLKCDNGFQSKTTQVIIAQRLSTIIDLDVIVIVDKGKVVEMGTHSTLVAAPDGVYSRLYHLQSFSEN